MFWDRVGRPIVADGAGPATEMTAGQGGADDASAALGRLEAMAVVDRFTGSELVLARAEERRAQASLDLDPSVRSTLGQYFTPVPVATLMADMAEPVARASVRTLDPGAGSGSLTSALVQAICRWRTPPERVEATLVELDPRLAPPLRETLDDCERLCTKHGIAFSGQVRSEDFLRSVALEVRSTGFASFDIAVLNPPYRKIGANSPERTWTRACGVEVPNLYAAFIAATVSSLAPDGQLVAITPRSFTNGTYFRRFRRFLLDRTAIRKLHVFEARDQVFRDDGVLQENLIMEVTRGARHGHQPVLISSSRGPGEPTCVRQVKGSAVVDTADPEAFIRLPIDDDHADVATRMVGLPAKLEDLGLTVSTGPVVDFRVRESLREATDADDSVPLLYPATVQESRVIWPPAESRKPCAISVEGDASRWLVPDGDYVLVRRFSAKEERRRVVAGLLKKGQLGFDRIGLENHLNYFHQNGHGIDGALALGLTAYLNSSFVDTYIRLFNGHTQVNASDLRALRYPSASQLRRLARSAGSTAVGEALIGTFSTEANGV